MYFFYIKNKRDQLLNVIKKRYKEKHYARNEQDKRDIHRKEQKLSLIKFESEKGKHTECLID